MQAWSTDLRRGRKSWPAGSPAKCSGEVLARAGQGSGVGGREEVVVALRSCVSARGASDGVVGGDGGGWKEGGQARDAGEEAAERRRYGRVMSEEGRRVEEGTPGSSSSSRTSRRPLRIARRGWSSVSFSRTLGAR